MEDRLRERTFVRKENNGYIVDFHVNTDKISVEFFSAAQLKEPKTRSKLVSLESERTGQGENNAMVFRVRDDGEKKLGRKRNFHMTLMNQLKLLTLSDDDL